MFERFLNKTKYTKDDLIKELLSPTFNLEKANKIINSLNVDVNTLYFNNEFVFHTCCKKNLIQAVLWFLDNKVDIEKENELKETAIFYAIHSKSSVILQSLIECHVNLNHMNIYNRTALQDAVITANNRIVNYLLEVSTPLTNCDVNGNNLMFDAVSNGNIDIIRKIGLIKNININHVNNEGDTVLQKENVLKNIDIAVLLLDLGANPIVPDKNGKNFLFHAVAKGISAFPIIEKAARLRFNINIKSPQNTTLLMESINCLLNTPKENEEEKASHLEMIKELMQLGINVDSVDNKNENAFFLVTRSEDRGLITTFLENCKVNLNCENNDGETVLSILAIKGIKNNDLIKLFLTKGANPNYENKFGKCIIEILSDIILHSQNRKVLDFEYEMLPSEETEYPNVLENIMRNSNVDINAFNSKGEPLFFDSILHFNFNLFKLLRTKNINLNRKDKEGNNIVFKLMEYYYKGEIKDQKLYLNTIKSLLGSGVDINAKNNDGLTALHLAIVEKCEFTIRLLLDNRADCYATDNKGRTIMHNCIWKNTTRYFKLIHHFNKEIINIPDAFGIRPINYAAFMGKKDLVIDMLDVGALINNPNKKDPKILQFLEKFHSNIINITDDVEKEVDKVSLKLLADNMIKEFNIKV